MRDRLTRQAAAEYVGVSLASFLRHIAPDLTPVRVGRRVFYWRADVDAWLERDRAGLYANDRKVASGTSGSSAADARLSDPQVQAFLKELRGSPVEYTRPRLVVSNTDHVSKPGAGHSTSRKR